MVVGLMGEMGEMGAAKRRPRRDPRLLGVGLTLIGVILLGGLIVALPEGDGRPPPAPSGLPPMPSAEAPPESPAEAPVGVTPTVAEPAPLTEQRREALKGEVKLQFDRAVVMLHARQYEYALVALQRVIDIAPKLAEAYVNAGYALIGLERWPAAAEAFYTAIDLNPRLVNAYYGLAVALEGQGELLLAIGAMESFVHRAEADDPFHRKASAALWEWRDALNRERTGGEPLPEPPAESPAGTDGEG